MKYIITYDQFDDTDEAKEIQEIDFKDWEIENEMQGYWEREYEL